MYAKYSQVNFEYTTKIPMLSMSTFAFCVFYPDLPNFRWFGVNTPGF